MKFFSILYQSKLKEDTNSSQDWIEFVKPKYQQKERKFEYIGTRMVEVKSTETTEEIKYPLFFEDLNINQIMNEILNQSSGDEIRKVFYQFISDEATILYRQDIMKDLENVLYYNAFSDFQNAMKEVQRNLENSQQTTNTLQSEKYYLDAIDLYCNTLLQLQQLLNQGEIHSQGITLLKEAIRAYTESELFQSLSKQSTLLKHQIESISYTLIVSEHQVQLRLGIERNDYKEALIKALGEELLGTQYNTSTLNKITLFNQVDLCPLEIEILNILKLQYEQVFVDCHHFIDQYRNFIAPFIERLNNELSFYIRYINYMNKLKEKGFSFTYPNIALGKQVNIEGLYDLSLAQKLQSPTEITSNIFQLKATEAGAWITGANQGGKTTFARSLGQAAYFTVLGLPIAAKKASLPLYEQIYTHFSEIENAQTSNGKLKEELLKLKPVMKVAGEKSLIIMNELFSSTTANDAFEMGKYAVEHLISLGSTVISVTHVTALSKEGKGMVSMVAQIDESCSNRRTYQIVRQESDGLVYTASLVSKHHLTYKEIKERIGYAN